MQLTNMFPIRLYYEIPPFFKNLLLFSQFLNQYKLSHLCRIGISIPRLANPQYSCTVAYKTCQSVVDQHKTKTYGTQQKFSRSLFSAVKRNIFVSGRTVLLAVPEPATHHHRKKIIFCLQDYCMGLKKFNRHSTSTEKKKFSFLDIVLLWCTGLR